MKQELLSEHWNATLTCLAELESYRLHLLSAPACAAAFLAEKPKELQGLDFDLHLLDALRTEWHLVLKLEAKQATADLLHTLCPQVLFQTYREILSTLEVEGFCKTPEFLALVKAWFPALTQSANVEDLFSDMQDCTKRQTRTETASVCNLSAVGVKGLMKRLCDQPGKSAGVTLCDSDFSGREIRCLKSKLFSPDACPPGHQVEVCGSCCH